MLCGARGDFRISHKQSDESFVNFFVDWLTGKNLTSVFISTDAENSTLSTIKGMIAGTFISARLLQLLFLIATDFALKRP